jgi:uncharacterized protein YbjT (DUF2867 family)
VILVAGGTGHLGRELVELLASHGRRVRVMTRDVERARPLFPRQVELVEGDVREATSLVSAVGGVETVISAITGFGLRAAGPAAIDARGNSNLIAAAESAGVARFVLVSIHGAAADHALELYRAKYSAEQRLRASRLDWTILRPTVFMELWAGIVGDSLARGGRAMVFGRGDNPINFVSVRDLARFAELALTDSRLRGAVLDVGGPENLSLNDVVRMLASRSGRPAAARHVPLAALRLGNLLMSRLRPDLAGLLRAAALMDQGDMSFDPRPLAGGYPQVKLTRLAEVLEGGRTEATPAQI